MTGYLAILVVISIVAASAKPDKPLVRIAVESDGSLSHVAVERAGASSSMIALGASAEATPIYKAPRTVIDAGCHTLTEDQCCKHFDGRPAFASDCVITKNVQAPPRDVDRACQPEKFARPAKYGLKSREFVGDVVDCPESEDAVEVYLSEGTIAAIGEVAGRAAVNEACNSAAGLRQNISKILLAQETQLKADQLEHRQNQSKKHAKYVQDYSTERSQRREQITTVEHVAETTYVKAQQQAHKDLLKQELDSHIAEQQLQLEKFNAATQTGTTRIANDHKKEKLKLETKQKAQRDLQENQHKKILDLTPASPQTGVEVSGFIKRTEEEPY